MFEEYVVFGLKFSKRDHLNEKKKNENFIRARSKNVTFFECCLALSSLPPNGSVSAAMSQS